MKTKRVFKIVLVILGVLSTYQIVADEQGSLTSEQIDKEVKALESVIAENPEYASELHDIKDDLGRLKMKVRDLKKILLLEGHDGPGP